MWFTIARRFFTPSRDAATFHSFPPDEKLRTPSIFAGPSEALRVEEDSSKSTFQSAKSGAHVTEAIEKAVFSRLFIFFNQTAEARGCQTKVSRKFPAMYLRFLHTAPYFCRAAMRAANIFPGIKNGAPGTA